MKSQLPVVSERELILQSDIVAGRICLEASEDLKKEVFVSMKNNYISKMFFFGFLYPSKQFDCILSLLYLVEVTFSIMSLFFLKDNVLSKCLI